MFNIEHRKTKVNDELLYVNFTVLCFFSIYGTFYSTQINLNLQYICLVLLLLYACFLLYNKFPIAASGMTTHLV